MPLAQRQLRKPGHHRKQPDTGERDRTPELRKRHGWAWLRIFRRYDAYKAALDQIEAAEREEQRERELV